MDPIRFLIPPERPAFVLWSLFTGNATVEVADERHSQIQFLPTMRRLRGD
jgi:hypothetical protein